MTILETIELMKSDAKVLILRGEDKALYYGTKGQSKRFFSRSAERARRLGVTPYGEREARLLTVTEDGLFIYRIDDERRENGGGIADTAADAAEGAGVRVL